MRHLLLLLLVPLALALGACGDGDPTLTGDAGPADAGCAVQCGSLCCSAGQICSGGACKAANCVPNCSGKSCGDDGCGGSCGDCANGKVCNASGSCEQCQPSCQGKVCGSDGCGGSCGSCGTGTSCQGGQCQACTPNCTGKACGDDGCGGQCGTCGSGVCDSGACVECKSDLDCSAGSLKKCDTQKKKCVGCRNASDCDPSGTVQCSPNTNTCIVACTTDAQCAAVAGLPRCNTQSGLCVSCLSDGHCAGTPATPNCDTLTNTCVKCVNDSDCSSPTRACKEQRACVECTTNGHCGGDRQCDVVANRCVDCVRDADCPGGFCTTAQKCAECRTAADCSGSDKACIAGNCVQCGSNADCAANTDAKTCDTVTNSCVACNADADCSAYPGMKRCLTASKACVACTTATQATDCPSKVCLSDNTCEPPKAENDTCSTATALTFTGDVATATVDTTIARDDYQASCGSDGYDVVYSVQLSANQRAVFEATGRGSVKPVLFTRTNCTSSNSLDQIDCATSGATNKATTEIYAQTAGTYYVLLGDGGTKGTIDLKATLAPANDGCNGAKMINPGAGPVTEIGSTSIASDDHSASVGFGGKDVAYIFSHFAGAKTFKATLTPRNGSQATGMLALRTGCSSGLIDYDYAFSPGTPVTLEIPSLGNGTYYLWVDGTDSTGGDFTLTVSLGASGPESICNDFVDNDGDGAADCLDSDCAFATNCQTATGGESCSAPINMSFTNGTYQHSGTTVGAINDATSAMCTGASGPDRVYKFTTTQEHDFVARVDPVDPDFTSYRPILYMRRANCTATSSTDEVACDDAGTAGGISFIRRTNLPAGTYHVWVDGAGGTSGAYNLGAFTGPALQTIDGADTCAQTAPVVDGSGGASWNGTLVGKADNLSSTCSVTGGADVYYDLTLPVGYPYVYVQVTTTSTTFQPVVEARQACATATTSCAPNANVAAPVLGFAMPADYATNAYRTYLVIDSKAGAGTFTVDVWGDTQ